MVCGTGPGTGGRARGMEGGLRAGPRGGPTGRAEAEAVVGVSPGTCYRDGVISPYWPS